MNHEQPLGFHRVMENNPIAATDSPLFTCPTEVLANIVDHLGANPADLASLALVNSDCRQLARSWQFRTLTLSVTPRNMAIVGVLVEEAQLRRQNKIGLSLGACIRKIVTTNTDFWTKANTIRARNPGYASDDNSEEAFARDEASLDKWRKATRELSDAYDAFFRIVDVVLTSLPHLLTLNVSRSMDLTQASINWLQSLTTVRHLTNVEFDMTDEIICTDSCLEWPLETLEIRLRWDFHYGLDRLGLDASQHWHHLLRPCAPSLQSLKISHSQSPNPVTARAESPVTFDLKFPQLRYLDLTWCGERDFAAVSLRSLIATSNWLSYLSVAVGTRHIRDVLEAAGRIPTLETLILNNTLTHESEAEKNKPMSLTFLKNNPQLNAFAFKGATKPHLLDKALAQLSRFNLTKLSMFWEGKENDEMPPDVFIRQPSRSEIPETSLRALSNLVALEDLHLDCVSTEQMNVFKRDWYVDHSIIRQHLGPSLRKLRRLALTRDIYEYRVPLSGLLAEGTDLPAFQGMPTDFLWNFTDYSAMRLGEGPWRTHVQHMQEQAVEYAKTFPQLEFLHIGELSFGISRGEDSQIVLAERDDQKLPWVVGSGMREW